jgi:pyruvate dehydrogenase E1 component beta subunit
MFLALDQMLNAIAKWRYMFDGKSPQNSIVIRAIVGRGWGQGATHSQNLATTIAHFPGIKVMLPAFPYDAGGMLKSALKSNDPVVLIEHRSLFDIEGQITSPMEETSLKGACVISEGKDLTIVSSSICTQEVLSIEKSLLAQGVSIELIDLRTITPIDILPILKSVRKTGKLLVIEPDWTVFGIGAEICAQLKENLNTNFTFFRLGHENFPAPVSQALEPYFYTSASKIFNKIMEIFTLNNTKFKSGSGITQSDFKGPY